MLILKHWTRSETVLVLSLHVRLASEARLLFNEKPGLKNKIKSTLDFSKKMRLFFVLIGDHSSLVEKPSSQSGVFESPDFSHALKL